MHKTLVSVNLFPVLIFCRTWPRGRRQTIPQMPNLANWVAPTLNVEELDKRIDELKAVHFWLDQNSKALGATMQALEVQKMTLATLKGMNFNIGDVANALKLKAADSVTPGCSGSPKKPPPPPRLFPKWPSDAEDVAKTVRKAAKPVTDTAAGLIDPMQLWGFSDPAVSANCRQCHERRRQRHRHGRHQKHGDRVGQRSR